MGLFSYLFIYKYIRQQELDCCILFLIVSIFSYEFIFYKQQVRMIIFSTLNSDKTCQEFFWHLFLVWQMTNKKRKVLSLKFSHEKLISLLLILKSYCFSLYSPIISTTRNVSTMGSITSDGMRVSLLFWMFSVSRELRFSNTMLGRVLMLVNEKINMKNSY